MEADGTLIRKQCRQIKTTAAGRGAAAAALAGPKLQPQMYSKGAAATVVGRGTVAVT